MHPKISIITVSKNSEDTIAHTLNSIKSQTYQNIEHIIIDGKSNDKTIEIVKHYIKKKPSLKIKFISESDEGIYDAINKGIALSSGEYISILNSDDIFHSHQSVARVMKAVIKNQKYDLFFFGLTYFRNNIFNKVVRYYPAINFKTWMLKYGIIPPHPASVIKKTCYEKNGCYDKKYKIAGDFDLFLRLIYLKKVQYKTFKYNSVRMKTGGASGKNLWSYIISLKENCQSFSKNNLLSRALLVPLKIPSKLTQYIFLNQNFLNLGFKLPKQIIDKEIYLNQIKVISSTKKIIDRNFVLSGLNLAFLGYYFNNEVKLYKNLYHWQDGIFSRIFKISKFRKLPGRRLLKNLKLPKYVKNIIVLGNLSKNSKEYLKNKFNKKIVSYDLPFGNIDKIVKSLPKKFPSNSIILITLPTPKQEIIAEHLIKNMKNYKIICIGASLAMCAGEEKIVPNFMEKRGLEFLWRLKTDTRRRLIRLLQTFSYYIRGRYNGKDQNIVINKI